MDRSPAKPLYRLGSVVQAVPLARAVTVAATVTALAALAVTLLLARDRAGAAASALVTAAIWSAGATVLSRVMPDPPPPVRVSTQELPPEAAMWSAVLPVAVILAVSGAAAVTFSLGTHEYDYVGLVLGLPAGSTVALSRVKRTQRESHGVLWTAAGMTWSAYGRVRYLSPEQVPGEDVLLSGA